MTSDLNAPPASPPRSRALSGLRDNPVILKELRGRMRGARAFVVLTIYLLLLGAFTSLIYVAVSESALTVGAQVNVGEIGRTLFTGVVGIEMMLVAFIAPAFTAGAISGEREHQTYDLLRTTLLSPSRLVLGKLLSALLYVLLLLLAAIPLQSIAFFFGGVAETEVFLAFLILFVTALLFCTMGIYFSSRTKRTMSASVLTYAVATFVTFGLPLILGSIVLVLGIASASGTSSTNEVWLFYFFGALLCINPAATAVLTQYVLLNEHTVGVFSYTMGNGQVIPLISPWIPFTLIYLGLTVLFFILSVRRVRMTER
ncbi:ABC transporter permease [Aggregatilinea lenta]|uniref:ABC transporter permease n=1 Tax=Aggregatilinea lenta TaxID=913108 RepID=UPI000E5C53FD|nr:ABC transporter permease subunit [Aggregatilinea lenta]